MGKWACGGLAFATHAAYGGAAFALEYAYGGLAISKSFAHGTIVVGSPAPDSSAFDLRNAWPFELLKSGQEYGFWIFGISLCAALSVLLILKKLWSLKKAESK